MELSLRSVPLYVAYLEKRIPQFVGSHCTKSGMLCIVVWWVGVGTGKDRQIRVFAYALNTRIRECAYPPPKTPTGRRLSLTDETYRSILSKAF
ncbi:hypothetical protein GQ43DRAFT_252422 [Delitschia confertaspora ATCC 74209]|uniref:Uncharacterized protein n=1 Tax=Delitschia confertaspora ATCC 74209 TaxID=1513339 RepID=A0A9P4JFZ5_9PLEO|nr:hypothetical protein GQ43DRAFT_252422 [Delitschia confertaspora ATCC 74209]